MNFQTLLIAAFVTLGVVPACVSTSESEEPSPKDYHIRSQTYGVLDREDEVYPWLSPKYDKGIYSSSAETAPFRDNAVTSENLRRRIQKTSKKTK
jgi:hypothetical protein